MGFRRGNLGCAGVLDRSGRDRFSEKQSRWRQPKIPFLRAIMLVVALGLGGCLGPSAKDVKDAQAHFKLGMSSLNRGEIQPAKVEFEKAIESNPKDRDAHYALGHIYYVWGKFEEAEKALKKTISIDSEFSAAYNYLGKVYEQQKLWNKAVTAYESALSNPKYETPQYAHFNLGIAYKNLGRYDEAINEFYEALRIDPNFVVGETSVAFSVQHELGQVYEKLGRVADAKDSYRKALTLAPNFPEGHFNLAVLYFNEGSKVQAKEEFEAVINLVPDAELAKNSRQYLEALR